MSKGAPADKLVVGMASLGKSWTLWSAAEHNVGDIQIGTGASGSFSNAPGLLYYYEVLPMTPHMHT